MRPAAEYHHPMRRLPLLLLVVFGCGPKPIDTPATPAVPPPAAGLRGLCVVRDQLAWASGTDATVIRTADGGTTWQTLAVPGAAGLDFRDVEAFGAKTAYLLAAGPGDKSRIYKTTDAGATWELQLTNPDANGFLDALAFWDEAHGLCLGDPVDGRFQLFATSDGVTWAKLPREGLPRANDGEGAFAASGTCLICRGHSDAWFVTGGKSARVFHSTDRGRSWTAADVPVTHGPESAGCFSIAFRDDKNGVTVGGDYKTPDEAGANAAYTTDGGKTWAPAMTQLPFRSCVAWSGKEWVAVGTSGEHNSPDGRAWNANLKENWSSVAFDPSGRGFAVGPKGAVVRLGR